MRIVFYSHDTVGLGHVRRNLLIAHALRHYGVHATMLVVCGSHEASALHIPPGADCLTLPALHKSEDGRYDSRSLEVSLVELSRLRSAIIDSAVQSFQPDVLIVDNVPRGASRELDCTLTRLRATTRTRCILGLRDVLDDPDTVSHEWRTAGNADAVREYYDEVWIYGDPNVYDAAREYQLEKTFGDKLHYLGYLDQRLRLVDWDRARMWPSDAHGCPPGRYALCLVGGGQDGWRLARAFSRATVTNGLHRLLLTGPFMPAEERDLLLEQSARDPHLTVVEFVREPLLLIDRAACVVSMGGYNTVTEALSLGRRALVVPRVTPRQEQLIRAQRLARLGVIDMLHPDDLTPAALTSWLDKRAEPAPNPAAAINLSGLRAAAARVEILMGTVHQAPGITRARNGGRIHAVR